MDEDKLVTLITDIDISVILYLYGVEARPRFTRKEIIYRGVPYHIAKKLEDMMKGHVKIQYI